MAFLKASPWPEKKVPLEQLEQMFLEEYNIIRGGDANIPEDEVIEEAKSALESDIAALKKGGAVIGKGVGFGITGGNNYIEMWNHIQVNGYKNLLDGKTKFVSIANVDGQERKIYHTADEMIKDKLIAVKVNKDGVKTIIALEKRSNPKDASDPKNQKRGKPYPTSSYMSNYIAHWESSVNKKKYLLEPILGGEQGDSAVNPICTTCGNPSFSEKCEKTTEVIVNGHKKRAVCGATRDGYLVPAIMRSVGTLSTFSMAMKLNEDKSLKNIEVCDATKFVAGEKLTIKSEYVRGTDGKMVMENGKSKKSFQGMLMSWIPSDRVINSTMVDSAWRNDKIMVKTPAKELWAKYGQHPVFYFGTLYQMKKKAYYGFYEGWMTDERVQEGDEGMKISIPEHVMELQMKNKFGLKSLVLAVGILSRKPDKDFKAKKPKMQKVIVKAKDGSKTEKELPVFGKPFISISCFIPIVPRLAEEEKVVPKSPSQ